MEGKAMTGIEKHWAAVDAEERGKVLAKIAELESELMRLRNEYLVFSERWPDSLGQNWEGVRYGQVIRSTSVVQRVVGGG
jgi:hypothetical protein